MIITYANVFLFVLMSKKSVITLFEKSLSSPKSIPFRVEAPIISPYKFLIMNLLYNVLFRECHRITSRRLYFGVCILLPLFCLFFMATIFGNGQMENIPIGIVDQDNTAASHCRHTYFPGYGALYGRSLCTTGIATEEDIRLLVHPAAV